MLIPYSAVNLYEERWRNRTFYASVQSPLFHLDTLWKFVTLFFVVLKWKISHLLWNCMLSWDLCSEYDKLMEALLAYMPTFMMCKRWDTEINGTWPNMFWNMTSLGLISLEYKCNNLFLFSQCSLSADLTQWWLGKTWLSHSTISRSVEWDISVIWELNYWDMLGKVLGNRRPVNSLLTKLCIKLPLTVCWLAFDLFFQTEDFSLINLRYQF